MKTEKFYENYPVWIILTSNFLSLAIYALGAYILAQLGLIWLILYLAYLLILEVRLLKGHCIHCYYYGKYCAFGQGKLSSLFFKKGSPEKFTHLKLTWKSLVPDFLVSLIPILIGIILLIINFSWLILILVVLLVLFSSLGNGFVRGSCACKYCKQRELGCPAERLFNKTKK